MVVGELLLGPPAGGGAHGPAQLGVVEEAGQGGGHGHRILGPADHEPGLAVRHRLVRAAAGAGHAGHPAGRGLEEDDPEALLLQAAPAAPARHGEDVGRGRGGRACRRRRTKPRRRTGAPVEPR